jgi:hypothetical protein
VDHLATLVERRERESGHDQLDQPWMESTTSARKRSTKRRRLILQDDELAAVDSEEQQDLSFSPARRRGQTSPSDREHLENDSNLHADSSSLQRTAPMFVKSVSDLTWL